METLEKQEELKVLSRLKTVESCGAPLTRAHTGATQAGIGKRSISCFVFNCKLTICPFAYRHSPVL